MNAEQSQARSQALAVRAFLRYRLSQRFQEPLASAALNPALLRWLERIGHDRADISALRAYRRELAAGLYAAESLGLDWELVAVVLGTTADQARLWAQLHHEQRASDDDAGAHITFDLDLSEEAA